MVYEHYTGECWHRFIGDGIMKYMQGSYTHICNKCGNDSLHSGSCTMFDVNPPLATSLDAWAQHIWPALSYAQMHPYFRWLLEIVIAGNHMKDGVPLAAEHYLFAATPIHHLEAALRAAEVDEWPCGSNKNGGVDCPPILRCKLYPCTNGKRSLYSLLMEEVG
jgi:hypothetical protein